MSHKNALSQYESGLCPASYGMSLSAGLPFLWWCVLKTDVQIDRPFKKGGLSEEPLKSMPTSQEK